MLQGEPADAQRARPSAQIAQRLHPPALQRLADQAHGLPPLSRQAEPRACHDVEGPVQQIDLASKEGVAVLDEGGPGS